MLGKVELFGINWLRLLVCGLLTELGVIFLAVPFTMLKDTYIRERQLVARSLGEKNLEQVEKKSSAWFRRYLVDTGILEGSYAICNRQGRDRFDDRGFSGWFANRLDVFWMAVRQVFFRFQTVGIWLPCVPVMLLPVMGDSYCQRQIRKYRFTPASPLIYGYTRKFIAFSLLVLTATPFFPLTIPPLIFPVLLGLGGLALWLEVAYTHKRV
ncbi:MAG: DUF4400 domain-containing protein [Deltaproteobacteria bacterium]|nr:DUF4400 domain-containing protein [Deltaproteobacteria bacterium]